VSETKKKKQAGQGEDPRPETEPERRADGDETPQAQAEAPQAETPQGESGAETDAPSPQTPPQADTLKDTLAAQEDKYLRLCAEYDNFRKRSQKEKEARWAEAKSDTIAAFLPVYDNLERALKQDTADEAFKKGVEMTMTQLKDILTKLGVEVIQAQGQPFDPTLHNAVMHIEDENLGENTVAEVFQAGFKLGEKVIRFAMVKVAN
jgi:molecular chaperone GrpE